VISAVNLEEDYERLLDKPWLDAGMKRTLKEIKRLLDKLPHASSVSITSPDQVARELFTHTGSGTLVRRGERVLVHETLAGVDKARLRGLLETCFQRSLADDYFEKKAFHRVYLAESYRATAIITEDPIAPYLDKFAVTAEAQGAGIGGSLWARMKRDNPKLYWRARNENEVNTWYFQQAHGSCRDATWTVFWYGLSGFDEIRACVEHALALPATLHAHGNTEG
jgi:acetylglutamate synthase